MTALDLLTRTYRPLLDFASDISENDGWAATQLPGWCVRDLLFHLATDAQRALVALFTPSTSPVDTDEISYWRAWKPNTDSAQAGLRGTRIIASAWTSVRGPADLFTETALALLCAAESADLLSTVTTQGRVLTVDALLRTLTTEASVHHLDLAPTVDEPADPAGLMEAARVSQALLGAPRPVSWPVAHYVRVATGRRRPTADERGELGSAADQLPAFG